MKWFVLIMFLSFNEDGSMDSFVFTEPNFNDEASCRATLTDMIEIIKYVYILLVNDYYLKFENKFEDYFKKGYDIFLKNNNQ